MDEEWIAGGVDAGTGLIEISISARMFARIWLTSVASSLRNTSPWARLVSDIVAKAQEN